MNQSTPEPPEKPKTRTLKDPGGDRKMLKLFLVIFGILLVIVSGLLFK